PRGRRRRDLIWGPYLVRAAVPVRDPGPRVAGSRSDARMGRSCGRRMPVGGGGTRITPAGAHEAPAAGPPLTQPIAWCQPEVRIRRGGDDARGHRLGQEATAGLAVPTSGA